MEKKGDQECFLVVGIHQKPVKTPAKDLIFHKSQSSVFNSYNFRNKIWKQQCWIPSK